MSRWKKSFTVLLCSVLVLMLAVSCAAPATPTPTVTPTPSSTTPTPSPTPTATTPAREKIVRIVQSWPVYIDPAVGSDNVAELCANNFYDTLITLDESSVPQPRVAEKWLIDPATLTYTFTIRQGIKFHNGDTLAASDVVYSLKRMMTIGEGWGFMFRDNVKDVSAPDAQTVTITLAKPIGPFLLYLLHLAIVNEKLVTQNAKKEGPYGTFGDYGKEWLLTNDAGSGPYMVKEMNLQESVIGTRFPDYWQGWDPNAPDSFKVIGSTEPVTVRTLMAQQQLELSDEWQPTENYDAMAKLPGVKVANLRTGAPLAVMFNTSKPPFDDVHFRRAVMYAFDYKTCTEQILPGSVRSRGPVSPVIPGGDIGLPIIEQDMTKAAAELALSPYANQLDQYPIEFWWNSVVPDQEKISLLLQSNCAALGITVNVVKSSWTQFVDAAAKPETTPHIFPVIETAIPYPEAGAILEYMYKSSTRGTFSNMHWFDATTQAEIDQMLDDALATIDTAERLAKYKAIIVKLIDLAPTIWAVEMPQRHAYQAGYLEWPTATTNDKGEKINLMPGLRVQFKDFRFKGE